MSSKPITNDDLGKFPDYMAKIDVYERDGVYFATEHGVDRIESGLTPGEALLEYVDAVVGTEGGSE